MTLVAAGFTYASPRLAVRTLVMPSSAAMRAATSAGMRASATTTDSAGEPACCRATASIEMLMLCSDSTPVMREMVPGLSMLLYSRMWPWGRKVGKDACAEEKGGREGGREEEITANQILIRRQ